MKKSTKINMMKREKRIQDLIAEGSDRNAIMSIVSEEFGCGEKTVSNHYYEIINGLSAMTTENKQELRATLMARQEAIYKKAFSEKNLKTALEATNAQAKLGGLFNSEVEQPKRPEAIIFKERDFSKEPLTVVPKKAENN